MEIIVNNQRIPMEVANTFTKRLIGFMGKKNIQSCLCFKTNSIHTFFMKEAIDVVMTDSENKVLYIFKNVKKNKIIIKKNVSFTYEFPNNFISNLNIKDQLKIINKN